MTENESIINDTIKELARMAHDKFGGVANVVCEHWHDPHEHPWRVWSESQSDHYCFATMREVVHFLNPAREILFRKF